MEITINATAIKLMVWIKILKYRTYFLRFLGRNHILEGKLLKKVSDWNGREILRYCEEYKKFEEATKI